MALASALAAAGCGSDDTNTPVTTDTGAQEVASDTSSASDTASATDTFTPADTTASDSASDSDVGDEGGAVPLYK